jgi:NAD(P)-dependent dehydrogenase (short-subunit alcohol dehydrogenase family)
MVRVHCAEAGEAPVSAAIAGTSGAPRLLMTATHVPMKISAGTSALGAGGATSCQANRVEQNGLVVITGAAGALGHAVVAEFRGAGQEVVALDRAGERLERLGEERGVHAVAADLADRDSVVKAWLDIDEIGVPSALVTLAGGFRPSSLADLTEELWDEMWRSNVASVLWSAQQAAPRLAAAGGGAIVTVGSKTAVSGAAPVAHATSKAAVVRITELLADELRPQGIRVNCVLPSVIDTPANREWMSPELAARAVAPAAIARVIAFLAGPDSAPTSGARVPVYGDA